MKNDQPSSLVALFCMAISVALVGQAQASISTSTETVTGFANVSGTSVPPNAFQITFSGLPTDSVGGGVLSLETFGDFNAAGDWIDISIDGTSFGRLWDINPANDEFDGFTADDDKGQQYGDHGTNSGATLELSEGQLDGFLADGFFVIGFDEFGPGVGDLVGQQDEFITATLEFEVGSNQGTVPEPTTFVVWSLLGALGICGWRRKDRR